MNYFIRFVSLKDLLDEFARLNEAVNAHSTPIPPDFITEIRRDFVKREIRGKDGVTYNHTVAVVTFVHRGLVYKLETVLDIRVVPLGKGDQASIEAKIADYEAHFDKLLKEREGKLYVTPIILPGQYEPAPGGY